MILSRARKNRSQESLWTSVPEAPSFCSVPFSSPAPVNGHHLVEPMKCAANGESAILFPPVFNPTVPPGEELATYLLNKLRKGELLLKMSLFKIKKLLSILMDSSLYLTLPLRERRSLLVKMADDYPFLVEEEGEQKEVLGYEASWAGIFRTF